MDGNGATRIFDAGGNTTTLVGKSAPARSGSAGLATRAEKHSSLDFSPVSLSA